MKKATMKDIARQANVSVATVSYVLNNVKNQTIPDPTRQSILQIARELNYVPNLAARSLVKQRTGLVGILINRTSALPYWKRQNYMSLVESLEAMLTEAGYHTLLVRLNPHNPAMDVIRERKLDAVFVLDVMDEMFYRISANFVEGVPLILIDSIIDDRLFNQVNYNYPQALQAAVSSSAAPSCLVMESYYNKALSEWVIAESALPQEHIHIVNNSQEAQSELMSFLALNRDKHVIVINEFLAKAVEKTALASSVTAICTCGVPEILLDSTTIIQFQNDRALTAYELMTSVFREQYDTSLTGSNQFLVEVLQ
ncbi:MULTISPECIES: LacI family DNA-binding transcriptional regulator [Paenibacillus]|uniref:HTH lacI-type domain-containing protein n=1 Tax=Paenibacillus borealis TaxID=160799 RepID=A0ABX3HD60_PAEBO|nr:LacI family DNA-binding transcriptional regulator [Paenibacillus borealis]OMD47295.1 hypothetical protein BSK56_14025 [Paenibacillus borealis]